MILGDCAFAHQDPICRGILGKETTDVDWKRRRNLFYLVLASFRSHLRNPLKQTLEFSHSLGRERRSLLHLTCAR